ncbi:LPXTG-protein cell wall anchor protein [Enterococcus faecium]|uniref:LPXTG cell wall anchor domain-containing protein n=1 Tax=Enterococcus faecium TaxID=1352 RepID=UPI000E13925C|nr:LPXTG cell wall anchor domain-containing protein [Enterococcus faecium]MCU1960410.1 LPXTG cell wall anchor domain-containing protein [Enterococcus faecium]RBS82484.1 LPXTG-protein cell wall anchor protein [Enterococcus faecium]
MKKRMKPLIWPIAVSSIFLLGQTAFAETSEPAQTEPSTTISSSDAENGASETETTSNVPIDNSGETISSSEDTSINSSTSSDQIDHLQDLENKRKELEEALEAAKNKLKEDQAAIDQDLANLKNKVGNDRAQLEKKLAEAKAEAVQTDLDGKIQQAKEFNQQLNQVAQTASGKLSQTQADITAASQAIHGKISEAQTVANDFEAKKADLAASFQRIKDILHSAGEKSVTSGSTTETVQQTTEPSKSTSQTLPKTNEKTASVNYSFVGTGVLVAAAYGIIRKKK